MFWDGEDYALLILEDDPNRSGVLGRMGMCSPSNSTIEGLPVHTAGYPGALDQCANSPDPEGYCDGWMYTQECSVTDHNLYAEEFGHDCTTNEGQIRYDPVFYERIRRSGEWPIVESLRNHGIARMMRVFAAQIIGYDIVIVPGGFGQSVYEYAQSQKKWF